MFNQKAQAALKNKRSIRLPSLKKTIFKQNILRKQHACLHLNLVRFLYLSECKGGTPPSQDCISEHIDIYWGPEWDFAWLSDKDGIYDSTGWLT